MKSLVLFALILFSTSMLYARKVAVTLTTDNLTTPTVGMLRYCIDNAQKNDTIIFQVGTVNLLGEIYFSDSGSNKSFVIDGGNGNNIIIDGGQNGRILNFGCYSSNIAVKNITFINGKLSKDMAMGGALYIYLGSSASIKVENCSFSNNEAVALGANGDGQGGAVRTNGGVFNNCTFQDNKVTGTSSILGGGALTALGGVFTNCVFMNNNAKYGGAIFAASGVVLNNCTITDNHCVVAGQGAGIDNEGATLTNCIIYNNTSNSTTDNIKHYSGSYSHCAMEPANAQVGTNNNIGLSASPFTSGVAPYNLSLKSSSTCINGGTASGITVLDKDVAGNVRISGGTIDMGAFEYGSSTSLMSNHGANELLLYPNPSNGIVYFDSSMIFAPNSFVEVYNLNGVMVTRREIGEGMKSIDLSDFSGLLQLRIVSGDEIYVQKIYIKN